MCQSRAWAQSPLMCHPDPRPSLPQGEPAGDAACIRENLRWCRWDSNELQFRLGEVLQHPGPAGRSQSFLCDSQLGTHPLWPRTARTEWPYLQEAASSVNLEGCVCWSHSVGHNSSPGWGLKGQDRSSHPAVGIWGDSGPPLAHVILREPLSSLDSGTKELELPPLCAMHGTLHNFEETGPGLYTEDTAQVSGPQFRF